MSKLCEVRSLMAEALQFANDVHQEAPPEFHTGLDQIKNLLDSALERIDGAMDPDPRWPRLAARA